MKYPIFLLGLLSLCAQGQTSTAVGKPQPGAVLERFTLSGGRTYDGIWDPGKSQIHVVSKSNHVANASVQQSDIISRKKLGDGSSIAIYSDVDIAEKVVIANQQNYQAAQARLAAATQRRDTLHATYGHKTLPQTQYTAVMAQYKAADDEIAAAQKAVEAASQGVSKAQEAYAKSGGKKQLPTP